MSKFLVNVSENWVRDYIVEADSEEEAIQNYIKWKEGFGHLPDIKEKHVPRYIDDGPVDTFFARPYDE